MKADRFLLNLLLCLFVSQGGGVGEVTPQEHKPYFLGTALDFVLEHGEEYGLYEPFLNKTSTYDPNRETKLEKKFFVRNHTHHYLLGSAQTSSNPSYSSWGHYNYHKQQRDQYQQQDITNVLLEANNKFRFGHGTNDRFTDIFISEDPWHIGVHGDGHDRPEKYNDKLLSNALSEVTIHEPTGYIDFATGIKDLARRFNAGPDDVHRMLSNYASLKKQGREFVHFVGLRPGWLPDPWGSEIESIPDRTDLDMAICKYTYPHQDERPLQIIGNWTLGCEIPFNISTYITKQNLSERHLNLLQFDLNIGKEVALRKVQLERIHAIDRRRFNYTVCTMVDDINSPLLIEWLTYHSLLGVEHFYIMDNSKIVDHSSAYLWDSRIRPFLDSNVVTLIHFPFLAPTNVSWNSIQEHSFYTAIQKYGIYSEWMGFFDIDEFFGLNEKRWPSFSKAPLDYLKTIPNILDEIWGAAGYDDRVPAIVFDTIEMGCRSSMYNSGNDTKGEGEGGGKSIPKTFEHAATARYCTYSGVKFTQNPKAKKSVINYGHGKLFARPKRLLEPFIVGIMQPHQIDSIYTLFPPEYKIKEKKQSYPLFYHFDHFHYGLNRTSSKDYNLARFCGRVVRVAMNLQ